MILRGKEYVYGSQWWKHYVFWEMHLKWLFLPLKIPKTFQMFSHKQLEWIYMMFNPKYFAIKNPKSVARFVATGWLLLMVALLLSFDVLLLLCCWFCCWWWFCWLLMLLVFLLPHIKCCWFCCWWLYRLLMLLVFLLPHIKCCWFCCCWFCWWVENLLVFNSQVQWSNL